MRVRVRRRLSALAALALAALAGIALFWTAQRVQTADANLQQLKASNAQEKESLRVLHAEWDYLNRPDRIEALARTQLNMMPPGAGSVAGTAKPKPLPLPAKREGEPEGEGGADAHRPGLPSPPSPPSHVVGRGGIDQAQQQDFNALVQSLDKKQ